MLSSSGWTPWMTATAERPTTTIFRRPSSDDGLWSWLTTVDHKRIGIMYGYAAFTFFIIGGHGPCSSASSSPKRTASS